MGRLWPQLTSCCPYKFEVRWRCRKNWWWDKEGAKIWNLTPQKVNFVIPPPHSEDFVPACYRMFILSPKSKANNDFRTKLWLYWSNHPNELHSKKFKMNENGNTILFEKKCDLLLIWNLSSITCRDRIPIFVKHFIFIWEWNGTSTSECDTCFESAHSSCHFLSQLGTVIPSQTLMTIK